MRTRFPQVGIDFLFVKLHGMWSQALAGDALLRIVNSGQVDVLIRFLAQRGVEIATRVDVQKRLALRFIDDLARLRQWLDPGTAGFYGCLIEWHFIENLKTLLHYRFFPTQDVPVAWLLIESPHLPPLKPGPLLAATDMDVFWEQLPAHPIKETLRPILIAAESSRDLFTAECRLDQLYYQRLLDLARLTPAGVRNAALHLVRSEVDIANMVIVMRNARMYKLPAATVATLCLDGGLLLDGPGLNALAEGALAGEYLSLLPKPYRDLLQPLAGREPYLQEGALWNLLHRRAYATFMDYERPEGSLAAFPVLRQAEALNASRVYEGLRFGLAPAQIAGMMIGVSRV
jgi:vacuolar-type H+-ATPase subunit C/Vma6